MIRTLLFLCISTIVEIVSLLNKELARPMGELDVTGQKADRLVQINRIKLFSVVKADLLPSAQMGREGRRA